MSKSTLRNRTTFFISVLAVCLCLAAAVAYFTDRAQTDVTLQTSENAVDITTDPVDPDNPDEDPNHENNLSLKWSDINAVALANFNPGDRLDLGFTLKNTGVLAVDVRETFFITSSLELTANSPEFRLFDEVVQDAVTGAWRGAHVVETELVNANTIKYTIAPYVLSSLDENVDNSPVEAERDYSLVFNENAKNAFQAATCQVEYLVEAKQHSDAGPEDGWTQVQTAVIEFGGQQTNAVPDKDNN